MSLIPPNPQQISTVETNANEIKRLNYVFVKSLAAHAEHNIRECWCKNEYSPQEFLDQLGIHAKDSLNLNAKLVEIVHTYETLVGEQFFNYNLLAEVKPYTVNSDGTITVN